MNRNAHRIPRGYSNWTPRLKDLRTEPNFNYSVAMNRLYFEKLTGEKSVLILLDRVLNLTEGECRHFIPCDVRDTLDVNVFVAYVKSMMIEREEKIRAYQERLRIRSRSATDSERKRFFQNYRKCWLSLKFCQNK